MQRNQGAISRDGPGAAAERDYAGVTALQNVAQCESLNFTKFLFAILLNDFGGRTTVPFRDEGIEIDKVAFKLVRQFLCDSSLAASHETENDDTPIHCVVSEVRGQRSEISNHSRKFGVMILLTTDC